MSIVVLYLLLCVIAAFVGKESRLGFWGIFLVSLLLTPVMAFLLVLLFGRRDPAVGAR